MKLETIDTNQYIDANNKQWDVNADNNKPVVKQHLDKVIKLIDYSFINATRPFLHNIVIVLHKKDEIGVFIDRLNKYYIRKKLPKPNYISFKEHGEKGIHFHIALVIDKAITNPTLISRFLAKNTSENDTSKLLSHYSITEPYQEMVDISYKINKLGFDIRTEEDKQNAVYWLSYMTKTRTKNIGNGKQVMSCSRSIS